jgi:hypothetical protein
VFKAKTFGYLLIIGFSAALVALGTQEFKQQHDRQRAGIEVNSVQRMLRNFRGVNQFERASFSAEQYRQLQQQVSAEPKQESFTDTVNDFKMRLGRAVQALRTSGAEPSGGEKSK